LGEEYRSLSFSLCSCLHSLVTSSHLGPNILNTLFLNTLSLRSSLNWATKFHTHTLQLRCTSRCLYCFFYILYPLLTNIVHRCKINSSNWTPQC
jgi:hypothetical protein